MPPPTQIRQMPPPQQTQPTASPVAVVPATGNSTVVTSVPPPVTMTTSVHALPDAAPGTIEADPQHDGKSKFYVFEICTYVPLTTIDSVKDFLKLQRSKLMCYMLNPNRSQM